MWEELQGMNTRRRRDVRDESVIVDLRDELDSVFSAGFQKLFCICKRE